MNAKQRKEMIENWVKKLNPNAVLRNADIRCGKRCAVFVVSDHDQYGVKCTDFLPLEQLEQYLLGVFHANDFYSKRLQSIKPKCTVIKMKKSRWNSISALLRKISQAEGVEVEPAALKEIAVKSQGDVRSAINTLQALADKDKVLDVSDVENMVTKDTRSDIFNAITAVLKSKTPAHVKEAMWIEEDPTLVMEYIAENIPREYKKKDEIKKAYDYISKADIFFGRTNRSRNYGYWKYATDFMGIGVTSSKHETYKKFTKIQTPSTFRLMGSSRGKRNLRDNITERMFEKMHVSSGVAVSMFPYLEIMFQNDELAWEISDFLGFFDEKDE